MTWDEAVTVMRRGGIVRRVSESVRKLIDDGGGIPIFEAGTEPCKLAHAWTVDEKPVQVYMGAWSKEMLMPCDEMRGATDWIEAPE